MLHLHAFLRRPLLGLLLVLIGATSVQAATSQADVLRAKLQDPEKGIFVVAHRGCHNPAPTHHLGAAPENSALALEHCVTLGVDMMELDVRRTQDGVLVIIHDETVDRTTEGHGRVADLTLAQLKALRLRDNFGGAMSPTLTDQRILTLDEALALARGRILLNLDIKEEIYPEVVAAAGAAGMSDYVLVKKLVADERPPLADQPPFDGAPFMPMIGRWANSPLPADVSGIITGQAGKRHRAVGVEMVYLTPTEATQAVETARRLKIRRWANTITAVGVVSVVGVGGDIESLRGGGSAWRELLAQGFDTFQTDEPGALIDFLRVTGRWR
jgi:glycerophosphoryl diester phosphodiesterase